MKALLILLAVISFEASAKVVTKSLQVNNFRWDTEKKLHRLEIQGKSGAYFADENLLPCFKYSVDKKKTVELTFDVHSMVVKFCKVP